ncbi:hypothetical protein [Kitasatospora sp. NPDC008115]|uniref:hypothetical protein n=1 Tax=Kitasatospora sp. NPDC008115 TaxID=3364022 RepID=UPI0036E8D808
MRANHATRGPDPVRRTVGGGWRAARRTVRRAVRRWLPRPRAVAAGGALLAQLWGFGAPLSCAAGAEGLPEPADRTVGRALTDGAAAPGNPAGQPGPGPSGGLLNGLAGAVPGVAADVLVLELDAATGSIGGALQEVIRAGGLPLPGQRAAVPDAFAIASGLLGAAPAQVRPAEARATRGEAPDGPSGPSARPGGSRPSRPDGTPHGPSAPPPAPAAPGLAPHLAGAHRAAAAAGGSGRPDGREHRPTVPGVPALDPPVTLPGTATRTAAVTVAHDTTGTATAVLAPITAGLLLTGAAMYKHRGLPKGH